MVETGGWGGIAHYTWNLCEALADEGLDVRLFTHATYELDGLPRRFTVERCVDPDVRYPRAAWRLARRLAAFAPEVVHLQSLLSTRFDALLWQLVRRRRALVMTAHNVQGRETGDTWASWTLWRCFRMADAVVVHTQDSADRLRDRLPAALIETIHQGGYAFFRGEHALDREGARRRLGLPLDGPLVLAFGAIRPYKGLFDAIAALPRIRARHGDARLVIVGPLLVGSEEEYRAAIERAGVMDAVIFRPRYVPHDEVAAYFGVADVAIYNYREITDSASLRLACEFGVPLVATRVGAFREFLIDGVTARLIKPAAPEELADAVSDLLADPAMAARLAEAARVLAETVWSWPRAAKSTVELYRGVLRSPRWS